MRVASIVLSGILVAGCAAGPPPNPATIVPYENGLIVATAYSRSADGALRKAVSGARMECDDRDALLSVIRTTTSYRGVVAKEINETVSKVGDILAGIGEDVPDLSTRDDYKVAVEFRCNVRQRAAAG